MADIEGLSNEEIREIILEQIKDAGVSVDVLDVEVTDGPSVSISGEVETEGERFIIRRTVKDIVGIDDLQDELILKDEPEDFIEESARDGGLLNRDDDDGEFTEDTFESMEEGIPYIPPDRPYHDDLDIDMAIKKRKRRSRKE